MSGSAEHRMGLVECPLCHNLPFRRHTCKACEGAGKMAVDKAIELGLSLSDTEPELPAVKGDEKS